MVFPIPVRILDGRIQIDKIFYQQVDNIVYGGKDLFTGEEVAVKAESKQCVKRSGFDATSPLQHEAIIMKDLEARTTELYTPRVIWEQEQLHYHYVAMEMKGLNLSIVRRKHELSDFTVLSIGVQIMKMIKEVHQAGFLHLDIKPDNFVVGKGNKEKIYLIDFGQSEKFPITPSLWGGVENDRGGNIYFASILWHDKPKVFVWDDLESVAYTLAYLKFGDLPWLKYRCQTYNEEVELMRQKVVATKQFLKPNLTGPSSVIFDLLMEARRRKTNIPDYQGWITRFESARDQSKIKPDQKYEWC